MSTKKTILIVEDEKILLETIKGMLEENEFSILEAFDGEQGVKVALSQHPDLILLDLLMPGIGGMEALRIIREDSWGDTVPVIILTNLNATDERLVEGMVRYKPLFYLVKADWKLSDVLVKIKEALETKKTVESKK